MSLVPLGWELAKDSLHVVPTSGPKSPERTSEGWNWIPDLIRGVVFPSVPSKMTLTHRKEKPRAHLFYLKRQLY